MKKRMARWPIRVVFYRDEEDKSVLIAHCLEFDLLGHGPTRKQSLAVLTEAIVVQLKNTLKTGNWKNLFTQAPADYFMMFARGKDVAKGEIMIEIEADNFKIDKIDARDYCDETPPKKGRKQLAMA